MHIFLHLESNFRNINCSDIFFEKDHRTHQSCNGKSHIVTFFTKIVNVSGAGRCITGMSILI
jgi:hypothetical protein